MNYMLMLADTLLARLLWTSLQATLLIGALWLLCCLLPRLSAATRSLLWWLVGAQLVFGMIWSTPLNLPLLAPASHTVPIAEPIDRQPTLYSIDVSPAVAPVVAHAQQPSTSAGTWLSQYWRLALMTLWLAVVIAQCALAFRQWRIARRLLLASTPLNDGDLHTLCRQQSASLRLHRCPQLRLSDAIVSPQVTGLWHATVLLPMQQTLTPDESAMALAHELAHLQRGDLWMGWIPAIAQRLFFFHPLVTWAMREYAFHRETACDAQVMQHHRAAPQTYGRLLLRLGVAHPMHSGLAGASPTFQNLKRRLIMLQQTVNDTTPRTRGWFLVVAIALIGVLPYRVTASDVGQANNQAQPTVTTATTPLVPPAPPAPMAPPAPPSPLLPPPPSLPPPPPVPPAPPIPPRYTGMEDHYGAGHHTDIDISSDSANGFALYDGNNTTMNGDERDIAMVKQLRKGQDAMLWFRRGDKGYVVRDAAFVQRAEAFYQPVRELGQQQSELGAQQSRLGAKQGALGARQGELGTRQGQLAHQEAQLSAENAAQAAHAGNSGPDTALEIKRAQWEAGQQALGQQQEILGEQQDALGRQQEALGKQQADLGARQEQAMREANQRMDKLMEEALAKGIAQQVDAH